ncbi:MAG: hypothetical protein GX595_00670 [Lentisphaerae bacterium]|nr:hypothetical protein [Lentisphaerota bacterium]
MLALSALSALLIGGLAASAASAAVPPVASPAPAPAPVSAAASPAASPGWLNARDFGASGSEYSTTATTVAGAKEIVVAAVGDFQVGQGVMVSECHPRVVSQTLWGPRHAVVMGRALQGKAELRGYDGTQGDWVILLIDIPEGGKAFRWSEDLARTWHPGGAVGPDWQPLRDGLEVRFSEHDWEKGYNVAFSCRGQLVSAITAIDGTTVTLRDAPSRAVAAATLRHCDDAALQAAIDEAVKTRMNLHLPNGRYRLSRGLVVRQPMSFTLEGAQAEHTILDISEGQGACITLSQGSDATLRRMTMLGHSGFAERDQCGILRTQGSSYFWGFGAKGCNAVTISNTRRVLVEDCHGRRMATECFVSGSRSRGLPDKPTQDHSQSTVYLRCSAIDCGRNAFNDVTAGSENTSVIECRIVDVGGCAWEGASRFVKFVGNYVRNAGTVAMGNLGVANRDATFPALGAGQHLVANNIFESTVPYGGAAVRAAVGATQVHITHNTFVNFNASAVHLSGSSDPTHYPTAQAVVAGNLFDMTAVDAAPVPRTAIDISAAQVIVADNQILVRGECDRTVTALRLLEPAIDITVHDNLIRNCGQGLACGRASSQVAAVIDPQTFTLGRRFLPLEHRLETQLQGWQIAWLTGGRAEALSTVQGITGASGTDPVTVRLAAPPERLEAGRSFDALPPQSNWNLHDNTIADCLQPAVFDIYGSPTTIFRNNILTRGTAAGVPQAILVGGQVHLLGNHLVGFDEPGSAALSLQASAFRQTARSRIRDNVFAGCAEAVRDAVGGVWTPAAAAVNAIVEPAVAAPAVAPAAGAAAPVAAPAHGAACHGSADPRRPRRGVAMAGPRPHYRHRPAARRTRLPPGTGPRLRCLGRHYPLPRGAGRGAGRDRPARRHRLRLLRRRRALAARSRRTALGPLGLHRRRPPGHTRWRHHPRAERGPRVPRALPGAGHSDRVDLRVGPAPGRPRPGHRPRTRPALQPRPAPRRPAGLAGLAGHRRALLRCGPGRGPGPGTRPVAAAASRPLRGKAREPRMDTDEHGWEGDPTAEGAEERRGGEEGRGRGVNHERHEGHERKRGGGRGRVRP